ncbi:MAG: type I-A CRISPR-associated protein Cas5 [Desulfurococcales archaeon]|nr:type I-A CRISPR-associated protein Cas5 [Desulfurococcales archaeon]
MGTINMSFAGKAYVVDIEFVWGYQVGIAGLSKSPPTFLYPPPTTVLGAIAEAVGRSEGLGEASYVNIYRSMTRSLLSINMRPLNYIPVRHKDVNRILMVSTKTSKKLGKKTFQYPHPLDLGGSFDAPSRGKTIASPIMNDEPPKLRIVIVWKEPPEIRESRQHVMISPQHIWRIHRLGTKEGVVSVTQVSTYNASQISSDDVVTRFSFPVNVVEKVFFISGSDWVFEAYSDPYSMDPSSVSYVAGKTLTYAVPYVKNPFETPSARVKVSSCGIPLRVGDEVVIGVRNC